MLQKNLTHFQSCSWTAKLSIDFSVYIQTFVPLLLQKVPSYSEHILEKECSQNAKKLLALLLLRQGILLRNCLPERPVFHLLASNAPRATAQICYNQSRATPCWQCNILFSFSHIRVFFQSEMSLVDVSARVGSNSDFLHRNRAVLAGNCKPFNIARIFWNSTWLVMQGVNHITIVP